MRMFELRSMTPKVMRFDERGKARVCSLLYPRIYKEMKSVMSRLDPDYVTKVNWQFTTTDARVKLKRLYPSFDA